MSNAPLVSIGIPNYNYAHYITGALNSVISQTYQDLEVIIIDDLSTDNSIAVIENWIKEYKGPVKINFIKNAVNKGLTGVCNQILKNAHGKYFQTLDADDILLPDKIERQVKEMDHAKNAALIYSNIGVIDENGNLINDDYLGRIGYNKDDMPQGNIFEKLFDFNFIPLPSVLVNTEYARKVGGFNETLQVQDYYLWLKLSEHFEVIYMQEITAMYRVHAHSMSNSSLTNPRSIDSILNIKFSYYKNSDKKIKKIIRNNIAGLSAYLYRFNYPSASYWLKKNLVLNQSFKSIVYYLAIQSGISYTFFAKVKSAFHFIKSTAKN